MKLILVFDLKSPAVRQLVLDAYHECRWLSSRLPVKCMFNNVKDEFMFSNTNQQININGQYLASDILAKCEQLRRQRFGSRDDSYCILLITEKDLYLPGLSFVFGAANIRTRVAVVSLVRLHSDKELIRRELVHELGHCLGLRHCMRDCIMHYSNSLQDIITRSGEPCPWCFQEMQSKLNN